MNYWDFYFDDEELDMIYDVQQRLEQMMTKAKATKAIHDSSFLMLMKEDSNYVGQFDTEYWAKMIIKELNERRYKMKDEPYFFILNGNIHGRGDLIYMTELFNNYVLKNEMYGRDIVDVRVIKRSKMIEKLAQDCKDVSDVEIK